MTPDDGAIFFTMAAVFGTATIWKLTRSVVNLEMEVAEVGADILKEASPGTVSGLENVTVVVPSRTTRETAFTLLKVSATWIVPVIDCRGTNGK